mgnify:FL=1
MRNPHFDINKLAVIGAILVLLGDFIDLLVAYQELVDEQENKSANNGLDFISGSDRQRISRRFLRN